MLVIIIFNRVFHHAKIDAAKTQREHAWDKHFEQNSSERSQFKNSKCSFENKFNIEYFCVNKNTLIMLTVFFDVNFIMNSASLIINWTNKIVKNLIQDFELNSWHIRHYHNNKINRSIQKFDFNVDRKMLEFDESLSLSDSYHHNASTMMIIINKLYFFNHV